MGTHLPCLGDARQHQPDLPRRPLLRRHIHGPGRGADAPGARLAPGRVLRLLAALQPLRPLRPHGHRAARPLLLPRIGSVDSGKVCRRGKNGCYFENVWDKTKMFLCVVMKDAQSITLLCPFLCCHRHRRLRGNSVTLSFYISLFN